jgi:hypothetical protein
MVVERTNHRSFDFASRDEVARSFAQDDTSPGDCKECTSKSVIFIIFVTVHADSHPTLSFLL